MLIDDRYDVTGSLSKGGMSEAREGYDTRLDRKVIIKCLQPHEEFRRIIDEQKALMKIRSKHVVELLDVFPFTYGTEQTLALFLEYIDGSDFSENMFSCDDDYIRALWQIAAGLAEIHAHGIIHRDVKPGNIRQDSEGVVKIFDFGLAREDGVDNHTRSPIGTAVYMAPELFRDETIELTQAADTYAFGVMALTLLDHLPPPSWCWKRRPLPAPDDAVESHVPDLDSNIACVIQLA